MRPGATLIVASLGLATVWALIVLFRRAPVASIRTCLAMLVVAVSGATLLGLPLALHARRPLGPGAPGGLALGPLELTYLTVASEVPLLVVVWLRLVRPRCLSWRELGLRLQPFNDHLNKGLAGGVALFITAAAVGAVLSMLGVRQTQFERFEGVQGAPLPSFLMAAAAGCMLAPVVEELFFRGYVFQTFRQRFGPVWAYLFSAGLFALVHANLAAAAPIFVLGLMLAYIFQTSGSVVPGVIAHGLNNAIAFGLLYSGIRG